MNIMQIVLIHKTSTNVRNEFTLHSNLMKHTFYCIGEKMDLHECIKCKYYFKDIKYLKGHHDHCRGKFQENPL